MDELRTNGRIIYFLWALLWSALMTGTSLYISSHRFNPKLFGTYLKDPEILMMNFVPIFLSVLLLSYLVGPLRISVITNALVWNILAYVHSLKILYRQEPLKFSDYHFLREAFLMAKKYSLEIHPREVILVLAFLTFLWFATKPLSDRVLHENFTLRLVLSLVIFTVFHQFVVKEVYSYSRYMRLGRESGLNLWQELNGYESKGFSYPLLYSITTSRGYIHEDYDEKNARAIDERYEDSDIPEGQKVNFMTIMLESYKDFYKYRNDKLVFTENPYRFFYDLAKESVHGNLIVNTFGGGTLTTESCFWSGYRNPPEFSVPRNTYISYFRDQGYNTEAFHPSDGLFNNRHNLYPKVGFEKFYYFQNYFSHFKEDISPDGNILPDATFLPRLLEKYKEETAKDTPYFSWSITYQGHGPYVEDYLVYGKEYVTWQEHYDRKQWMAFNNYLGGVADTTKQLETLVKGLRNAEPTILILFGDHSPSMGDNAIGMSMCGIPNDLSSIEGNINTYETSYIIWANPAARALLGKDLVGQGPPLDPNYLMTEVFTRLGWKGSKYNAFSQDVMKHITVTKPSLWYENGEWKPRPGNQGQQLMKDVKDYEYFISTQRRRDSKENE